jgi:hypothetical protein
MIPQISSSHCNISVPLPRLNDFDCLRITALAEYTAAGVKFL